MGDISREICLSRKYILNLCNHMVKRYYQLLQFDGNFGRFQSHVQVLRGNIFNGLADVAERKMPTANRYADNENYQQADYEGNGN